jgi:digeranylgeranylglycerophospholipid reductase
MQKNYDVVVIGAGPAGGQCARELAEKGKRVLLVEKAKDFSINNYSSGGAPAEILKEYALPSSVIGSFWNKIALYSSSQTHEWEDSSYDGIVLDFQKLRTYLAEQVIAHGSDVLLNQSYHHHHEIKNGKMLVYLRNVHDNQEKIVETNVLVDATGAERKVLLQGNLDKKKMIAATGIEYLIEVDQENYERYATTLSFFLGLKWMPQGYSWIFPMGDNKLKIGVVRYFANEHIVPHEPSYRYYLENMLEKCLNNKKINILDTHGKTLYYSLGQKDPLYEGNVIAIGDAISTLNPMASEGIRHAMFSGKSCAKCVLNHLNGHASSFANYTDEMHQYFGLRWKTSEFIMNRMYKEKNDRRLEKYCRAFNNLTFQEMLDFSFQYKLRTIFKFFWSFLVLNLGKKS